MRVLDNVQAGQPKAEAPAPAGRGALARSPVLVLNLNYVPINICTVFNQKANNV